MARKPLHSECVIKEDLPVEWDMDLLKSTALESGFGPVDLMLDVGCGLGQWGTLVAKSINPKSICFIDKEEEWLKRAHDLTSQQDIQPKLSFHRGTAEKLPFPDNSVDLVTCQTVLMHVANPMNALREFMRVLKPGGGILLAEPNNLVCPLVQSQDKWLNTQDMLDLLKFHLTRWKGRTLLGHGNIAIGEDLPLLLKKSGFVNVRVRQNCKTMAVVPPFTPAEKKSLEHEANMVENRLFIYDLKQAKEDFLAGGGKADEFDLLYGAFIKDADEFVRKVKNGTFSSSGGRLLYLISATK